jgi:hypothetical protein
VSERHEYQQQAGFRQDPSLFNLRRRAKSPSRHRFSIFSAASEAPNPMDKAYRRSQFSNDERLTDPATTSYVVDHKEMNMLSKAKVKAPITVLCLITCIGPGGAETMLYKLLSRLNRTRFTAQVISLVDLGPNAVTEKILKLARDPDTLLKNATRKAKPYLFGTADSLAKKRPAGSDCGCTTPT